MNGLSDVEVQAAMLARLDALVQLAAAAPAQPLTAYGQNAIFSARGETTDWEALTVTLPNTPGANGEHWVISRLTMYGVCAASPSATQPPITGLFLVPVGTPKESLDAGQSVIGWDVVSRGIPLASAIVIAATTIPGPPASFAYLLSLTVSSPLIVGAGQTLRGVVSCNPGTPQPGPGAGSWGVLVAMGEVHRRQP